MVFSFGLTSDSVNLFKKSVRYLVKFWRMSSMEICCFLDDGFVISEGYTPASPALYDSFLARNSLKNANFIANDGKLVWNCAKIKNGWRKK